jgi:hypothetical protein
MSSTVHRAALNRPSVNLAMRQAPGVAFTRIDVSRPQMRHEFLPDGLGDRRVVVLESGQTGTQRTFTRGGDFVADRIAVVQVERAHQWLQREALDRQRPEHDEKRGQHDQVAMREQYGQRHRPASSTAARTSPTSTSSSFMVFD